MEKRSRVADLPKTEARRMFSQVVDFEYNLLKHFFDGEVTPPRVETEGEYLKKIYREYINFFLDRAEMIKGIRKKSD